MLGEDFPRRVRVRVVGQAAAAFAFVAVVRADGIAPGARDRPQADHSLVENADVSVLLAFDAQGIGLIQEGTPGQETLHQFDEFVLVDRAAEKLVVHLDNLLHRLSREGIETVRLFAVDVSADLFEVGRDVLDRVDAAGRGARAHRDADFRCFAVLLHAGKVGRPRDGPFQERDVIVVAPVVHRLAEINFKTNIILILFYILKPYDH